MYIFSIPRAAAVRSAIWLSAAQWKHHSSMSASDGIERPCSILEILVKCQPARAASWRPDTRASFLMAPSR